MAEAKTSKGTYSVSASNSYKCGWRLRHKRWVDNKPKTFVVPVQAWLALGFEQTMSIEAAKARASHLNAIKSAEIESARNAANRVIRLETSTSVYLPEYLVEQFSSLLMGRRHSGITHKKKMKSHWKKAQQLIIELQIMPEAYGANSERIYDWFVDKEISLEYASKLIGLLNRWGELCCKANSTFFEKIRMPTGRDRSAIGDAYAEADTFQGESDALTPTMLINSRAKFKDEQFKWLFISVWFGLRPQEIDALKTSDNKKWKVETDAASGAKVLWIYQPKLVAIEKEKRWKPIPIMYPEQESALQFALSGVIKAPSYKKIHDVFGERMRLYGGRKNFLDMMLDKGQELVNISMWLGHQGIERSYTKYRNKRRVALPSK